MLRIWPSRCGVLFTLGQLASGVGGKRAGYVLLANSSGVYGGGSGDWTRRCLRPGVGVATSMSGSSGVIFCWGGRGGEYVLRDWYTTCSCTFLSWAAQKSKLCYRRESTDSTNNGLPM